CSCWPSPALTTDDSVQRAICDGTPADLCRTTNASAPMASSVATVSRSDSPFLSDELAAEKVITSAPSRRAAVSKESRVRVETSKKHDTTVLPRRACTLGMG